MDKCSKWKQHTVRPGTGVRTTMIDIYRSKAFGFIVTGMDILAIHSIRNEYIVGVGVTQGAKGQPDNLVTIKGETTTHSELRVIRRVHQGSESGLRRQEGCMLTMCNRVHALRVVVIHVWQRRRKSSKHYSLQEGANSYKAWAVAFKTRTKVATLIVPLQWRAVWMAGWALCQE
jgi:hypothetical protein